VSAPRTARALARRELTDTIKEVARYELAEHGPAGLSLRAVARELDMASSAIYRYFPSRDDLLTALLVDAYVSLGTAAERADAKARKEGAGPGGRWLAVCRAARAWAVRRPHEWALLYGSPVPGYRAPETTIEPAGRIPALLAPILLQAAEAGRLRPPPRPLPPPSLVTPTVLELAGGPLAPPYEDLVDRALVVWTTLVGTISFELFGHLHDVVTDARSWFDRAMEVAAEAIGLDLAE
jgi:AcrR family transcriptional regulator